MTIPVRQSTAFECSIGPVLDADGVAVTDCVVGDFKIKKTTGNFAALNGSATLTHVSAGTYDLVLTTSDVDTVGLATVAIDDTVNACAPVRLQVIEEAVYDRDFAASATGIIGTAQTGDAYAIVNSGTHGNAALKSLIDAVDNFVDTEITALQGDVTSILGDTNELQTDWANGGRLDLLLDAAKENTDYPDGYVYLDSANGGAGTTVGTNGTVRNPANSFDNAATIAVARGTAGIRLVPGYVGETIPASGSPSTYTSYLVDLAGSTLTIESGSWPLLQQFRIVSTGMKGKIVGDGGAAEFDQCYIENVSMNGVIIENTYADFYYVVFTGNITINDWDGSTPVKLFGCYSGLSDTPIVIDFTTSGANAVLQYWSGDVEIQNLGAGQVVEINGYGNCTINANCTGGTIKATSHVEKVDNASGAVTWELVSEPGGVSGFTTAAKAELQQEATDALNAYDPPTNAELNARTLAAADYATASALDAVDNFVDTEIGAIQTTLAALFTTALTESYRGHGATGSVAQLLYELIAHHGASSISGTTKETKKLDGSTAAKTYTLDDDTTPTSIVHAS